MSDDQHIAALLEAIRYGDERGTLMTNETLVDHLGWTPTEVASTLGEARAQLLIWGLRTGGAPKPHFEDLELTVQGVRHLRRVAALTDAEHG
jgi:hypothetical protein